MKTFNIALIATLAIFSLAVQANDDILIRNASVHTMTDDGILDNTDVLISNGKIKRIGKNLSGPKNVQTFDANGQPLTPGFFAGVTELGNSEVGAVPQSSDYALDLKEMRPEFDVTTSYNPHSTAIPVARVEGITFTLMGAMPKGSIFGGQGRVVALDGGYDSFASSPVLFLNIGRDASDLTGGSRDGQWMLLDQAMQEADNPPASSEARLLTRNGRNTLMSYIDGNARTVVGVDRASDILQILKFARGYGFNIVISGGAQAWMVAEEIAAANVPVMLNPFNNLPSNFDTLGSRMDNAAILHAAGVRVMISGAGGQAARKQRQMAGNAVANGLPHEVGIAALTSVPASVFGVTDGQGTIVRNQGANVVLWSGDPLDVTSLAQVVVINGKLMSMESRQTKLRDRYLPQNPTMPRAYIKP